MLDSNYDVDAALEDLASEPVAVLEPVERFNTSPAKTAVPKPSLSPLRLPNFDKIPHAMKAVDTWVTWRRVHRPATNDYTKVPSAPMRPYQRASSTDPTTWHTYAGAKQWYDLHAARGGDYAFDGIGFMLTPESGIVGIDLDHCANKETSEIAQWAIDLLLEITPAPYVELSPSGSGLHVYVKSRFPESHHCKIDGYEFYSKARFLTVTGHALRGSAEDVPDVDPAVMKKLHDRIFKERIEKARQQEADAQLRREALTRDRAERARCGIPEQRGTENGWPLAYARAACEGALRDMTDGTGPRHERLVKASLRLAGLAAGGAPGAERALDELRDVALVLMPGRSSEIDRTIKGARAKAKPAIPPVSRPEIAFFDTFTTPETEPLAKVRADLVAAEAAVIEDVVEAAAVEATGAPQGKPAKKYKFPINWEAFNESRAAMWATLGDPSLSKLEKKSINRMATCHVGAAIAKCNTKGCNHTHCRSRACQRCPCPSCGGKQRKNYKDAIQAAYAGVDADLLATTGHAGVAWYFEIATGPTFDDMAAGIEKAKKQVPSKLRERVVNFMRWGRSPLKILAWTRDEHTAEVFAKALNTTATKVSALAQLGELIAQVYDRRHAREDASLLDYVEIFKKHDHKLVRPGRELPGLVSKELSDELRASEWRRWTSRTSVSTAGKDAQGSLPWPDASAVAAFVRDRMREEREAEGSKELAHSWDCPTHGDDVTWYFKKEPKKDPKDPGVLLTPQPERGKAPTWKQVFESDPILSRYG